jgi:hypothetical protein
VNEENDVPARIGTVIALLVWMYAYGYYTTLQYVPAVKKKRPPEVQLGGPWCLIYSYLFDGLGKNSQPHVEKTGIVFGSNPYDS